MPTTVRYFPRAGIVMLQGRNVTTTFKVKEKERINRMLGWLGYRHVQEWQRDGLQYTATTSACSERRLT